MSTLVKSLRKQIEFLQSEIELYANAVDRLAAQLEPLLQDQKSTAAETTPMIPADKASSEATEDA